MPRAKCPACATIVTYAAGAQPVCPSCGFSGNVGTSPAAVPVTAWPSPPTPALSPLSLPPTAHVGVTGPQAPPTQGIAIAALLLNILVWPGLGTLVASRVGEGLAQGFLFLLGAIMMFALFIFIIPIFLGGALMLGVWIWALVTSIRLLNESSAAQRPAAV